MHTVHRSIHSIALVLKRDNPAACRAGNEAEAWLRGRGLAVSTLLHDARRETEIPDVDFVLVFGGDGTMIAVARKLMGRGIPFSGVNFGKVGFLADLPRETWRQRLESFLEEGFRAEARMSLRYSLYRDGSLFRSGEVVNDVVVTRGMLARLVNLELSVNGEPFMLLRSDGLIFSTPMGSTGYCSSAGGPLLLPGIASYVVVAICPFLSGFPPLVLHYDTVFSVTVGEAGTELFLTLDGQEAHPLMVGDRLTVQGCPERFLLASMGEAGYFERLLRVGFVQESKR